MPPSSESRTFGNFKSTIARPLRYKPEGGGFVIVGGQLSFNRPLYCNNTATRVDGGDRPEWAFYLPGRGGVLRVGVVDDGKPVWLRDLSNVTTRYIAGRLEHEIPLSRGTLKLVTVALAEGRGFAVQLSWTGDQPLEIFAGFGGASGEKFPRDGDIGTEKLPLHLLFQLHPDYCKGNAYSIEGSGFEVTARTSRIKGIFPPSATLATANADQWDAPAALLSSKAGEAPVLTGRFQLAPNASASLSIALSDGGSATQPGPQEVDEIVRTSIEKAAATAGQTKVTTPDPFINSAAAALCVAANGVWDSASQSFMHGAVAWRRPYLGWRGAYVGDALGQHDRTRSHLDRYFAKQTVSTTLPATRGADEDTWLSRSEGTLHSNGDLGHNHYDMNTVAMDALFRHLHWTGDLDYARNVWPVLVRHFEWQHRCFRREFTSPAGEKLPLYEAYAMIWASDDLYYSGGGTTHASAYQAFHHEEMARLAKLLGHDPQPYADEAAAIRKALATFLWLPDRGHFAETKDLLGEQLVHPAAAVWSQYHATDSHIPTPKQAWQMTRYIDSAIPHIPLEGPDVPAGLAQISESNWKPYDWSINNVVMAETMHTALAGFQAGNVAHAFALLKSAIVDHMCMGQCPGNLGCMSQFDAVRKEAQRDFADPCGVLSRTLLEGLFGIRVDGFAQTVSIRPNFPRGWTSAEFVHPDLTLRFSLQNSVATYEVETRLPFPAALQVDHSLDADEIGDITVNGKPAAADSLPGLVGQPRIRVSAPPAQRWTIQIPLTGEPLPASKAVTIAVGDVFEQNQTGERSKCPITEIDDPESTLRNVAVRNGAVQATVADRLGSHTVFLRRQAGKIDYWEPVALEVVPTLEIQHLFLTEGVVHLQLRNNSTQPLSGEALISLGNEQFTQKVTLPSTADSDPIELHFTTLRPGTNRIRAELGGRTAAASLTDWSILLSGRLKPDTGIALPYRFDVTRIFKDEYLSPRSPYTSLSIPKYGIGAWASYKRVVPIDDSALRAGQITAPIPFTTPAIGPNVAFVSQWDNHPRSVEIPLTGSATHIYFLLATSTSPMQSQVDHALIEVAYTDGTSHKLLLRNPDNLWPIDEDFQIDDFAFAHPWPIPPKVPMKKSSVTLKTDKPTDNPDFHDKPASGGTAFVADLPLDAGKTLTSVSIRAIANDSITGLLGLTLLRVV